MFSPLYFAAERQKLVKTVSFFRKDSVKIKSQFKKLKNFSCIHSKVWAPNLYQALSISGVSIVNKMDQFPGLHEILQKDSEGDFKRDFCWQVC